MITSAERQAQLRMALQDGAAPISATAFGKRFGVSRQTIVGDVALMRARGEQIVATPRGYMYTTEDAHTAIIVCRHTPQQAGDELARVIDNGGAVLDVMVDHPLYGQLRGELQIHTQTDINLFLARMQEGHGKMLSELTGGVHLHTIAYDTPAQLTAIKQALRESGYLYEETSR